MKTFYATTPIYYVNDLPHIGHAYTTIAADIMIKWKKLTGGDSYFVTGTDEHGLKISQAAESKQMPEREFVDGIVGHFKELWGKMGIDYDEFIRTTDERHKKAVGHFFEVLYKKGEIYKGSYKGWYCVPCETYFAPSQIDNGLCPDCKRELKEVEEESYFFKLSKYGGFLLEYYEKNPDFLRPAERANEIVAFVKEGLKDLSVSRLKVKWGIPVSFDTKHTIYVWFDALINYLTAAGFPDDKQKLRRLWPCDIHFVGKEIFKFHGVIWPAMLKAYGLEMPKTVFAHGWWTHNGDKMSKSKGNVVDPAVFCGKFGIDPLRYFLFREIPFGADGDFSEAAFLRRYNYDLANDLGNLASRIMNMLEKYAAGGIRAGRYPAAAIPFEGLDALIDRIKSKYESAQFHEALTAIWEIIDFSNRHIENKAPWLMAKNGDSALGGVMLELFALLKTVGILIYPCMPETAGKIMDALQDCSNWAQKGKALFDGHFITADADIRAFSKIKPLFPRIEPVKADSR